MKRTAVLLTLAVALCLCAALTSALTTAQASAAPSAPNPTTQDAGGVWADVCCGSTCGGQDYCIGSGTFTCCKGVLSSQSSTPSSPPNQ